ncbi:hypothetical protein GCM10023162_06410 [Klenkia terrae]
MVWVAAGAIDCEKTLERSIEQRRRDVLTLDHRSGMWLKHPAVRGGRRTIGRGALGASSWKVE